MPRAPITHWKPDDDGFWNETGHRVARRNLIWSIAVEFLGFSVWQLWSVTAVKLPAAGFDFSTSQLFWLVSLPGLVGATMRFPYTFAPGCLGGRRWTAISALLLLIPSLGLAFAVSNPDTPFWLFLVLAGTAGFGGGNFASSMANISFFYPDRCKGTALGINAAGGNVGVAVVQKLVPLVIGVGVVGGATGGGDLQLQNAGLVYVPLILVAAVMAWRRMDDLAGARSSARESAGALKRKYTWIVTVLYVGAFGSFIGYSAALPLVIKTQFAGVDPLAYAFLGPLVGSLSRPLGGWVSDRFGGGRVTAVAFAGMALVVPLVLAFLHAGSFAGFLGSMMGLFVLSGMANGSVYRLVPHCARNAALADDPHADEAARERALSRGRREAAAAIGFTSAVAAYGAFLIPEGFKRSLSATGEIDSAFYVFLAYYTVCLGVTWWYFLRRSFATRRSPKLADARA